MAQLWHAACNIEGTTKPKRRRDYKKLVRIGEEKMKKTITAITLAMVLMVSTSFANGGIIVAGFAGDTNSKEKNPCVETVKVDNGIIVAGLADGIIVAGFAGTGIIVAGLTGIIVAGAVDTPPVNCGIIVAG